MVEFTDDYNHFVPGVMYFARSIPSKEVEPLYDYDLEGCNCKAECKDDGKCACITRSGTFYTYSNISDIEGYQISECGNKSPTYECNENCSCYKQICGNRLVQFGPSKNLKVQPCKNDKGLGLFTTQEIKKGNFVCEYAGEIISENDAFQRFIRNSKEDRMNYIFCINEHFGEKAVKTFIDPTYYGNIGRYINHSCEPNCKLFVVRTNDAMPILGIFAGKDIKKNTEITYDYGEGELNFEKSTNNSRKSCFCGSEKCRKYLPFDARLSDG